MRTDVVSLSPVPDAWIPPADDPALLAGTYDGAMLRARTAHPALTDADVPALVRAFTVAIGEGRVESYDLYCAMNNLVRAGHWGVGVTCSPNEGQALAAAAIARWPQYTPTKPAHEQSVTGSYVGTLAQPRYDGGRWPAHSQIVQMHADVAGEELANHPAATVETWRRLMTLGRSYPVLAYAAGDPASYTDAMLSRWFPSLAESVVQYRLGRGTVPRWVDTAMANLAAHADTETLRTAVERFSGWRPDELARALEALPDAWLRQLGRRLLAPLFQYGSEAGRERAWQALSEGPEASATEGRTFEALRTVLPPSARSTAGRS